MRVRILKCRAYPATYLKIGDVCEADLSKEGYVRVFSERRGIWLLMLLNEVRFICPGVVGRDS